MKSPTFGIVDIPAIAQIIKSRITQCPGQYHIVVGTDSQNFDDTKVVIVIAIHHVGHGGFFFYDIKRVRRITNVAQKLRYETQLSLEYAEKLIAEFDRIKAETGYDVMAHTDFSIHVDAGKNGPSQKVIPEIVGWVTACGYHVVIKPDSFAACSVANKYSK